jgi:hypothetical protein
MVGQMARSGKLLPEVEDEMRAKFDGISQRELNQFLVSVQKRRKAPKKTQPSAAAGAPAAAKPPKPKKKKIKPAAPAAPVEVKRAEAPPDMQSGFTDADVAADIDRLLGMGQGAMAKDRIMQFKKSPRSQAVFRKLGVQTALPNVKVVYDAVQAYRRTLRAT